jgi:integrase
MLATQYAVNPLHLIQENPARGMKKPADGKQRRFLTLDEIAIMHGPEGTDENPVALAVIRLLLLTGLRRMEALALPRAWVDTQARCIRFGATKSGAQLRAIGAPAVCLLETLLTQAGSRWVFAGERPDGHFIAATAAGMGYSELTIAGLLGHSMPGVTARYAHVPDAALVSAG